MGLTPEQIDLLLKEEANQPSRTRGRKVKADPTLDRSVTAWFKLQHHLCFSDCAHRTDPSNPTYDPSTPDQHGTACWNPNCLDHTRPKEKITRVNAVFPVGPNKIYICRYCYLGGYLA